MPELPEVETIKRELSRLINNKTIKSVDVNLPKQIKNKKNFFLKKVIGRKITGLERRAKTLIIDLSGRWHLVFHLKMTGQLIYRSQRGLLAGGGHPIKHNLILLPNKYSHVIYNFTDNSRLFFNDLRQFGWVKLVNDDQLKKLNASYGPEPLSKEFIFKKFESLIACKKKPIKPLLMEQAIIAGVGNIYAQEACFCAKVLPTRRASELKRTELKEIYQCLIKILKLAVSKKGTSADNYVDAFGRKGSMEPYLKVYGRAGEPCANCGQKLKIIKQGARSTVYCAMCQK